MTHWDALATLAGGVGLFLLGMTMMSDGLRMAAGPSLERILRAATHTPWHGLGSGALVTALVQSSSAVTVATIGFVNAGLLPLGGALWVLFGANVGTTTTALLATMGATANAKRAAMAHVMFNVITAVVALVLLPWLLAATRAAGAWLNLPPDPATQLALFHTCFNLLGVALMWPAVGKLSAWLNTLFCGHDGDAGVPRFLDHTLTKVPVLATEALGRELHRLGHLAEGLLRQAAHGASAHDMSRGHAVFMTLDAAIQQFVQSLSSEEMSAVSSAALAHQLRVRGYHQTSAELAMAAHAAGTVSEPGVRADGAQPLWTAFVQAIDGVLDASEPMRQDAPVDPSGALELAQLDLANDALTAAHSELKAHGLAEAAAGRLSLGELDARLHRAAALRDAASHMAKASRWTWRPEGPPKGAA